MPLQGKSPPGQWTVQQPAVAICPISGVLHDRLVSVVTFGTDAEHSDEGNAA